MKYKCCFLLKWNSLFPLCLGYAWQPQVKRYKNKTLTFVRLALFSAIEELLKTFQTAVEIFIKMLRPALSQTKHRSVPRPCSTPQDVLLDDIF